MKFLCAVAVLLVFSSGCAHVRRDGGLKTYAQGLIYENREQPGEAIEQYRETLRKSGENSYIYVKMGNLYLKKQDAVNARKSFSRAVKLNPAGHEAFFGMGVAYLMEKNNKLAATCMEKGLVLEPENHSVRMLLCDIYVGMNMLNEAAGHYEILLDEYPGNYILHYNYGNILERLGRIESAEKSYLKTVELSDFFWKGFFSLGVLYNKQGKDREAARYLARAVEINPQDGISYSIMAGIHYKEGDNEKARRYLNEAIRNGIKTSEMYNFLGVIYSGEGDYTKAEESFREGIKIEDNSTGRFYLGTVYDKTGQKDSMVEELKRAIEINPDNAGALNYLGYTYLLENRDIEEAYEMIKKACSIEPDNGAFLDSLGWVYYKKGMYDRARELLEKAAGLEKDAEIFEHLGYVYLELKDYTKALYWFVRSYEMSSDSALLKMIEEAKERIKNELN